MHQMHQKMHQKDPMTLWMRDILCVTHLHSDAGVCMKKCKRKKNPETNKLKKKKEMK